MNLSIIIVSWNTREILRECLCSLVSASDNRSMEVIVVDNASADGSAGMIESSFPWVRIIKNDSNVGFAAANNQALRLARGRYLLLLNSDTVIRGTVIAESMRYMDNHTDVGVMGCRVLNPDLTVQPTCFQFPSLFNLLLLTLGVASLPWPPFCGRQQLRSWQRNSQRDVDVITGCYMFARKKAIDEVGLLDESFFFCGEETDWCRRFKKAGWRCTFAPVGEIIHIGNASGRQRKHLRDVMLTEGLIRYHMKHGGVIAALMAWLILLLFNISRLFLWASLSLSTSAAESKAKIRRHHFWNVVREFRKTWPRSRTARQQFS